MRKDLKEKLLKHDYSLYNQEWIEQTATDGFKRVMDNLHKNEPVFAAAMEKCLWPFEVMYYTAFEDALNTFLLKCLGDDMSKVRLCLDDLHKITATLERRKKHEKS